MRHFISRWYGIVNLKLGLCPDWNVGILKKWNYGFWSHELMFLSFSAGGPPEKLKIRCYPSIYHFSNTPSLHYYNIGKQPITL